MKLIRKWLRNRRLKQQICPRQTEIEVELRQRFDPRLELMFLPSKGGFDVTLLAQVADQPFGILRLNTPQPKVVPPPALGLKQPLSPGDRIDREWRAYQQLSRRNIAPKPLWRSYDSALCAHVPWPRASHVLRNMGENVWPALERIVAAVQQMHQAGIVHLDLNTGNIFLQPNGPGVCLVDFEYTASLQSTDGQQRAFDWLRLLFCLARRRRAGACITEQPFRFAQLYAAPLAEIQREVDQQFVATNFPEMSPATVQMWWDWIQTNAPRTRRVAA